MDKTKTICFGCMFLLCSFCFTQNVMSNKPELTLQQALNLAQLPLHCLNTEYPNKLSQTLGSDADLKPPRELHPAFYGCFDWHSSVHGHWSLVFLIKNFPNLANADSIKQKLLHNISIENIAAEIDYFKGEHNKSFERTYGWAWLLKLAKEIKTWDNPVAKKLDKNLQPLTDLIVEKYLDFLPKLVYPIRVGEHTNTAFGLSFAYDYAVSANNETLKTLIEKRAKEFYLNDEQCPLNWEPSGFDFLSPCLEEAALMERILSKEEFEPWIQKFLPRITTTDFNITPAIVSDRSDGKLVHLDGVNFSRAWNLLIIAKNLSNKDKLS
ncbi:MAG: hypothetical protein CR985_01575, partial [Flavobacteriales bacterium]